jgi:hypothetical protein
VVSTFKQTFIPSFQSLPDLEFIIILPACWRCIILVVEQNVAVDWHSEGPECNFCQQARLSYLRFFVTFHTLLEAFVWVNIDSDRFISDSFELTVNNHDDSQRYITYAVNKSSFSCKVSTIFRSVNLGSTVVTIYTTCFIIKKHCTLPTQYVYTFCFGRLLEKTAIISLN